MTAAPVEKMFYVGKRNLNLPAEDFPARWKQHAVLSSTVPTVADAVSGMAQCSRVLAASVLPGASTTYDGVSVMTVTDPQVIFDSQKHPKHSELLLPDELIVFTDYVFKSTVIGRERLMHAQPIERAKKKLVVIDILTRKAGVSPEEFDAQWKAHGERLSEMPGYRDHVLRHAQNVLYGQRPAGHDYDGISEFWFETEGNVGAFLTKAARDAIDADLSAFADMDRRMMLLTWVSHAFYRPGVLAPVEPH